MTNQSQPQDNPLHINLDVMGNIRKRYSVSQYNDIKKLIRCINKNNEIVVDNIPLDAADLKTLLGISKRSASILRRKLILDDIMQINIKCVDNKFVQIMVLSNYMAYNTDPSISNTFDDISKNN